MEQHKFGKKIEKLDQISGMVDHLIANPEGLSAIRKRMEEFPKKNGAMEVERLIEHLLKSRSMK